MQNLNFLMLFKFYFELQVETTLLRDIMKVKVNQIDLTFRRAIV